MCSYMRKICRNEENVWENRLPSRPPKRQQFSDHRIFFAAERRCNNFSCIYSDFIFATILPVGAITPPMVRLINEVLSSPTAAGDQPFIHVGKSRTKAIGNQIFWENFEPKRRYYHRCWRWCCANDAQLATLPMQQFGRYPVRLTCPNCQTPMRTKMEFVVGRWTWEDDTYSLPILMPTIFVRAYRSRTLNEDGFSVASNRLSANAAKRSSTIVERVAFSWVPQHDLSRILELVIWSRLSASVWKK